jgi:hypothetical protein
MVACDKTSSRKHHTRTNFAHCAVPHRWFLISCALDAHCCLPYHQTKTCEELLRLCCCRGFLCPSWPRCVFLHLFLLCFGMYDWKQTFFECGSTFNGAGMYRGVALAKVRAGQVGVLCSICIIYFKLFFVFNLNNFRTIKSLKIY